MWWSKSCFQLPTSRFWFRQNLKPSVDELADFVNENNESYNTRIENRFHVIIIISTNILIMSMGVHQNFVLCCYHYYHGDCLEDWKMFHLKQNKGVAKQINCSSCRYTVRDVFYNSYACEWKVDGSGE